MKKYFSIFIDKPAEIFRNIEESDYISSNKCFRISKQGELLPSISNVTIDAGKNIDGSLFLILIIKENIYDVVNAYKFADVLNSSLWNDYKVFRKDNCIAILDNCNNQKLIIRYIDNFGIYVFSGRQDLLPCSNFCSRLELNQAEFEFTIDLFKVITELIINEICINTCSDNSYTLVLEPFLEKQEILKNTKETVLPGALKRFYDKIGISY